jgi:hypothetical protein
VVLEPAGIGVRDAGCVDLDDGSGDSFGLLEPVPEDRRRLDDRDPSLTRLDPDTPEVSG